MVARQPLATVREARYGYAVANMGSNPHTVIIKSSAIITEKQCDDH
jgi:hypothetical protein